MREKEQVLRDFFATFDTSVLSECRRLRRRLRCARGELALGPDDIKEEPAEELSLDMENRRYNFYFRPDA